MARSARLLKKLHARHLIEVATEVVGNDPLVEKLWALDPADTVALNSNTFRSDAVRRYRLEYLITRGPVPGHWLHKPFDPEELTLFFSAKDFAGICHGWTLFND
ncbi:MULTISPECIES: hypothetical protein [unclassified Pseudomonas]|uniref:hypothetical protein n=1 Tax=unclassified Pseudomonas TaxID=196821 RepID=UPI0015BF8A40|nr:MULTISPECIES: hypothetical protein [unclassified Pseudomonas]MCS4246248.1 hypothetical protein [Pseudomonas sp. BIGb0164]NWE19796.1 hypothetical protein [Pseudomonas sp. P7548]